MNSRALISRFSVGLRKGEHCIKIGITNISNAGLGNYLALDRNIYA